MRFRDAVAMLSGTVVLAVPATALAGTLIGSYGNSNGQAGNSNQAAVNAAGTGEFTAPGIKFIDGNNSGTLKQGSTNTLTNTAALGGPGTVIGDGAQANTQGVNSTQGSKKTGTQASVNTESGTQLIQPQVGDAIIGTPAQQSTQGENSSQLAAGAPSSTTLAILGATGPNPLVESSNNLVISCQVVIGPGCNLN